MKFGIVIKAIILSLNAPYHDQDEQVLDALLEEGKCLWGQHSAKS
jgi:hypothetical protein